MKLEYIREFVVLADVRNFMRASDQLFIAQSSLSRHIQMMEEDLGVNLFDRSTRSLELTEYGAIFLPFARDILKIQDEYSAAFYNRMKKVSIGCFPVPAPYGIPEILAKFSREYKDFSVELTGNDDLQQLYVHSADFVFVRHIGEQDANLVYIPVETDSLVAVLPEDHPYANFSSVCLEHLKDEHFLFLQKKSKMYELCLHSCRKAGFDPHIAYSGSYAGNILALVKEHSGIALLTRKPLLQHDTTGIKIVHITPDIVTPICLVYLKKSNPSIGASHFIKCLKSYLNDERYSSPAMEGHHE